MQVPVDLMELAKTDLNGLNLNEAMSQLINRKSGTDSNAAAEEGKKAKTTDNNNKKAYS